MTIKLYKTSIATLEKIISLSKQPNEKALSPHADEENIGKSIDDIIEEYLITPPNEHEAELMQTLHALDKKEFVEVLALYYYFSKLIYDTTIKAQAEQDEFWSLCCQNSRDDIKRLGSANLVEYLTSRQNLATVFSTAVLNLK